MLIDTNIFLELLLDQKKANECELFLKEILEGKKAAFITSFSIDSVVLAMIRNNAENKEIINFLTSLKKYKGLKIHTFSLKDRINALSLIEKYNLDYEDSIILQTAISTKSTEIVSFDKDFDKVKEINRIEP